MAYVRLHPRPSGPQNAPEWRRTLDFATWGDTLIPALSGHYSGANTHGGKDMNWKRGLFRIYILFDVIVALVFLLPFPKQLPIGRTRALWGAWDILEERERETLFSFSASEDWGFHPITTIHEEEYTRLRMVHHAELRYRELGDGRRNDALAARSAVKELKERHPFAIWVYYVRTYGLAFVLLMLAPWVLHYTAIAVYFLGKRIVGWVVAGFRED